MESIKALLKDILKKGVSVIGILLIIIPVFVQGLARLPKDIAWQKNHIAALQKAYAAGEIAPVDEKSFFDGDLQKALDDGIRYNEMSFLATHNSYESRSVPAYIQMSTYLSNIVPDLMPDGTGTMTMEPLTDQLNAGIRSLEIDVEAYKVGGKTGFRCLHNPYMTMTTNCFDFELTLQEIKMWSDNNPGHMPLSIIIEPKAKFIPMPTLRYFNNDYAKALDGILRDVLGEKLFTPDDMLRDYDSFKAMRTADDWCKVQDMQGKVLVLLHFDSAITENYVSIDPSLRTQAMFPTFVSSLVDRDDAAFIITNDPTQALQQDESVILQKKCVVRTRIDAHPLYSAERRQTAMQTHAQIMSTDFPVRTNPIPDAYTVSFENGKTMRSVGQ